MPGNATAEADFLGARAGAWPSRPGRSERASHARPVDRVRSPTRRGVELMTQSTTRPTTDGATPRRERPATIGRIVRANLSSAELYEDAIRAGEGILAAEGPLVVRTGKHTGRSPLDKFIVKEPSSAGKIWWGDVNRPIALEHYDRLRARLMDYLADRPIYAQDCFIGAAPEHRRSLRVYTETAWASLFAKNLFRRASGVELQGFRPNCTIICVPSCQADPVPR